MERQNTLLKLALLLAPLGAAAAQAVDCTLLEPAILAESLPGGEWRLVEADATACRFDNPLRSQRLTLGRQHYPSASLATLAYLRSERQAQQLPSGGPVPNLAEAAHFAYRQEGALRFEALSLARQGRQLVAIDYRGEGGLDSSLQAGIQGLTGRLFTPAPPTETVAECEWLKTADARRLFPRDATLIVERAAAERCDIYDTQTTAVLSLQLSNAPANPAAVLRTLHRQSATRGCHLVALQELGLQAHGVYRCQAPEGERASVHFIRGDRQIELSFTSNVSKPDAATITALRQLARRLRLPR
ncbi:hypothetical protein [Chitinimonas lacunae]|uniref:DUF3747 domain-containing protein n=1 Tax=Chitinimonas lacunae TaxID=1963018 RepID=A0ABV8MSL1_9NEIS